MSDMPTKHLTFDEFKEKGDFKFNNKFTYIKNSYTDREHLMEIICPTHGVFYQKPSVHLSSKHGCPKCATARTAKLKTTTYEHFKNEYYKRNFNSKITFDKNTFVNTRTPLKGTCPKHGEIWKTPKNWLISKGCNECSRQDQRTKITTPFSQALVKFREKFGWKFVYDISSYTNFITPMKVKCKKHGWFNITPNEHLRSVHGCPQCGIHNYKSTQEFIQQAQQRHGNKYDYSRCKYVNDSTKVEIICPIHGSFWQIPYSHISGKGCKFCKEWKLEKEIESFLKQNNIDFIHGTDKFDLPWLCPQHLDFYLPKYQIGIECQGLQHFQPCGWSKDKQKEFEINLERDKRKKKTCEEHNVKLLYFSNLGIVYPYKVFEDKNELLKEIINE